MRRREFITFLGSAAVTPSLAWPLAARAQQPAVPVVGFLISATKEGYAKVVGEVHVGLREAGFVENRNLSAEYRFADEQYDRLPALAADLVRRQVAAIFSTGSVISPIAAKAATTTIPVVFAMGSDPVQYGLVASLARPGGNLTGVTFGNSALAPKRLELLREMLPRTVLVAMLVNPNNPNTASDTAEMKEAARTVGVRITIVNAGSERDLDAAFATVSREGADALYVHNDALFQSRRGEIVALAASRKVPSIGLSREFTAAGGLLSYGTSIPEMHRQAGVYIGRILKGEKPTDLPVLQPTKFELIVNLMTAKALGLAIPESFLVRADEVLE
jgi:putative ABC transport system substrate-binding protein